MHQTADDAGVSALPEYRPRFGSGFGVRIGQLRPVETRVLRLRGDPTRRAYLGGLE